MTIARHRYGWTTHTVTYTSAGLTNAGAGPRKPIARMYAANAAETTSAALYREAISSAASATEARIAASAVARSLKSDSASPTTPAAMSRPAMAVARVGCGRLWASITCEKLARDPHDAYAHRATRCRAGPRRGSAGRHSDEARAARRRGVTTRARGIRVGSDGRAAGGPGVDRLGGGRDPRCGRKRAARREGGISDR